MTFLLVHLIIIIFCAQMLLTSFFFFFFFFLLLITRMKTRHRWHEPAGIDVGNALHTLQGLISPSDFPFLLRTFQLKWNSDATLAQMANDVPSQHALVTAALKTVYNTSRPPLDLISKCFTSNAPIYVVPEVSITKYSVLDSHRRPLLPGQSLSAALPQPVFDAFYVFLNSGHFAQAREHIPGFSGKSYTQHYIESPELAGLQPCVSIERGGARLRFTPLQVKLATLSIAFPDMLLYHKSKRLPFKVQSLEKHRDQDVWDKTKLVLDMHATAHIAPQEALNIRTHASLLSPPPLPRDEVGFDCSNENLHVAGPHGGAAMREALMRIDDALGLPPLLDLDGPGQGLSFDQRLGSAARLFRDAAIRGKFKGHHQLLSPCRLSLPDQPDLQLQTVEKTFLRISKHVSVVFSRRTLHRIGLNHDDYHVFPGGQFIQLKVNGFDRTQTAEASCAAADAFAQVLHTMEKHAPLQFDALRTGDGRIETVSLDDDRWGYFGITGDNNNESLELGHAESKKEGISDTGSEGLEVHDPDPLSPRDEARSQRTDDEGEWSAAIDDGLRLPTRTMFSRFIGLGCDPIAYANMLRQCQHQEGGDRRGSRMHNVSSSASRATDASTIYDANTASVLHQKLRMPPTSRHFYGTRALAPWMHILLKRYATDPSAFGAAAAKSLLNASTASSESSSDGDNDPVIESLWRLAYFTPADIAAGSYAYQKLKATLASAVSAKQLSAAHHPTSQSINSKTSSSLQRFKRVVSVDNKEQSQADITNLSLSSSTTPTNTDHFSERNPTITAPSAMSESDVGMKVREPRIPELPPFITTVATASDVTRAVFDLHHDFWGDELQLFGSEMHGYYARSHRSSSSSLSNLHLIHGALAEHASSFAVEVGGCLGYKTRKDNVFINQQQSHRVTDSYDVTRTFPSVRVPLFGAADTMVAEATPFGAPRSYPCVIVSLFRGFSVLSTHITKRRRAIVPAGVYALTTATTRSERQYIARCWALCVAAFGRSISSVPPPYVNQQGLVLISPAALPFFHQRKDDGAAWTGVGPPRFQQTAHSSTGESNDQDPCIDLLSKHRARIARNATHRKYAVSLGVLKEGDWMMSASGAGRPVQYNGIDLVSPAGGVAGLEPLPDDISFTTLPSAHQQQTESSHMREMHQVFLRSICGMPSIKVEAADTSLIRHRERGQRPAYLKIGAPLFTRGVLSTFVPYPQNFSAQHNYREMNAVSRGDAWIQHADDELSYDQHDAGFGEQDDDDQCTASTPICCTKSLNLPFRPLVSPL